MSLEEYRSEIYRCAKCALCTQEWGTFMPTCPPAVRFGFESYYLMGRIEIARGFLDGTLDKKSENLSKIIYTCTECKACEEQCYTITGMKLLECTAELKSTLVEAGLTPPKIRDFLENIDRQGNPYGEPRGKRGDWSKGTKIKRYERGDEFLYHIGDVGSYDTRSQDAARALGEILTKASLSFGILGDDEECDGNEVHMLGEAGLFDLLVEKNTQKFKDLGAKKIVTLSPHAYNAFKNDYPKDFEVMHYTQLLRDLIKDGRLDLSNKIDVKVTYHDPCFLGRYNSEYDAPREILKAIPGVELIEIERNRENAFCCGGGGGNFYTDFLGGGEDSPSRVRVREARDTGAEILAVACPICLTMLNDAVKVEGLEEKLKVKDISEIVRESLR